MSVINLAQAREERQPHIVGTFACLACKHEWTGVAPLGTRWMECPSCTLPQGTPKYPFGAQAGDLELVCASCGGIALNAYKREGYFWVRCMGCGNDLTKVFWGDQ